MREGRVTKGADGKFDVDQARRELEANSHPKKRPPAILPAMEKHGGEPSKPMVAGDGLDEDDNQSIAEAARQLEWEKLRKARIANDEKLHQLVPLAAVNAWVASMILRSREVLTRIAPKLRDRIAQTTDPVTCEEMIRKEVDQALSELAEFRPNQ